MAARELAPNTSAATRDPIARAAPKGRNGKAPGASDEWYTPAFIFDAMGARFDLDVAAPRVECPAYDFCDDAYTADSLTRGWFGFVWMNAPFGKRNGIVPWLEKFFAHGDGVALVPDSTPTPWWQVYARRAERILFIGKMNPTRGDPSKVRFISGDGRCNKSPAHGTCLFASGPRGVEALERAAIAGLGLITTPQVSQPIREAA